MKHINKPFEVNLNVLEQKSRDKKAITEEINIAILILLGCAGLYFYSSITSQKEPHIHFSNITANAVLANDDHSSGTSESSNEVLVKEQLLIKGHMEAGEQVYITLENFDAKAQYRIEFGDGKTQAMTEKTIRYTYEKSGNYKVKLIINSNNQPVQKISHRITIEEPIGVTSGAFIEK